MSSKSQSARNWIHFLRVAEYTLYGLVVGLIITTGQAWAGVFSLETPDNANQGEKIVHPKGYSGAGGDVFVRVCLSPSSPGLEEMEFSIQRSIATWNGMNPVVGNLVEGDDAGMAPDQIDFESVMLHELGHCIGLGHPNMSGGNNASDATVGGSGSNGVFEEGAGGDGVLGSQDDLRGDDQNYHRFAPGVNDPFRSVGSVVDRSTYTRDLAMLPSGHKFARNGGQDVAARLGLSPTEAVMQQGARAQQLQRKLVADDVDTLRYARSGLDGIQNTSDDYDVTLVYDGIQEGCDIQIKQESLSPGAMGFCSKGSMKSLASEHFRFGGTATIRINSNVNWHYADLAAGSQYPFFPASCSAQPQTSCNTFANAKLVAKPGKLKLAARGGGIARFQVPQAGANFAACLYDNNGLVQQWQMPGPGGWKFSTQTMKYKSDSARFKASAGQMKFKAQNFNANTDEIQGLRFQVVTGVGNCWQAGFDEVQAHPTKLGVIKALRQ